MPIVQEATESWRTRVVILNASREACMEEFAKYCEGWHPCGYGTHIEDEGVDHGFLGDGYFLIVSRSNSCD